MQIDIITLFPEMFDGPFGASIIARAVESKRIKLNLHQLRDYATDRHRTVDGPPFGGGPGMVLSAPPLFDATNAIKSQYPVPAPPLVVLTSPQGEQLNQRLAEELACHQGLIIVCGHYGGVDQRFAHRGADRQISVGNYVLTGGELAAMVIVDAVVRLLPDVLGNPLSASSDSFAHGNMLAPPVYTRPADYAGMQVPPVLISGDHAAIAAWRKNATREHRTGGADDPQTQSASAKCCQDTD